MKKRMIENWGIESASCDLYRSPETQRICVVGVVAEHKGKSDVCVKTSYIVSVYGKDVTTRSGSVYTLGEVHPEYREWLKEHRPNWDPENPITLKD